MAKDKNEQIVVIVQELTKDDEIKLPGSRQMGCPEEHPTRFAESSARLNLIERVSKLKSCTHPVKILT
jgi:hypothetical protein